MFKHNPRAQPRNEQRLIIVQPATARQRVTARQAPPARSVLAKCRIFGCEVSIVSNSAQLSPRLSSLFEGAACAAELHGRGDPSQLLPAEAALLGRSVPKRAQEFAAGRICARLALAQVGILDFAIERAPDRQPIWPPGVVGSITHTGDYCAAVIASRDTTAAIGVDSEGAGNVKPELWPSICLAPEIDWLGTLPEPQRLAAATLIFSAKEAFYKCQYPLTSQPLAFHDACIELPDWSRHEGAFGAQGAFAGQSAFADHGAFILQATRPLAFAAYAPFPLRGRYLFHDEFVTAAVRVPARLPT